ncbi:MAG TPA: OsmC family protein [Roseiflexaceae bacterium]|jgi:putative redox protein
MTTELGAHVMLLNDLHFQGSARSGHTIDLDAPASEGGGAGMTPMELLLISLASCSAMDVAAILRKKRQPVEQLEVRVRSRRQIEHPTVFTAIHLEYVVHGDGVDPQAVTRAIELSRDRYCPIWAMLEPGVRITAASRVVCDAPVLVPAD